MVVFYSGRSPSEAGLRGKRKFLGADCESYIKTLLEFNMQASNKGSNEIKLILEFTIYNRLITLIYGTILR